MNNRLNVQDSRRYVIDGYHKRDRLDLETATFSFYIQEELLMNKPRMTFPYTRITAIDNFYSRLEKKQKELEENFAGTLFDYLVLACFGEARYANKAGELEFSEIGAKIAHKGWISRDNAHLMAVDCEPKGSLEVLSELFHNYLWPGGFGGHKWGNIADMAMKYGNISDKFFIDSVIDLEHNGGLAFNKGFLIKNPTRQRRFLRFLDEKTNGSAVEGVYEAFCVFHNPYQSREYMHIKILPSTYCFLTEAFRLNIIRMPKFYHHPMIGKFNCACHLYNVPCYSCQQNEKLGKDFFQFGHFINMLIPMKLKIPGKLTYNDGFIELEEYSSPTLCGCCGNPKHSCFCNTCSYCGESYKTIEKADICCKHECRHCGTKYTYYDDLEHCECFACFHCNEYAMTKYEYEKHRCPKHKRQSFPFQ